MDDLWLGVVRHGQSTANQAATDAAHAGLDLIEVSEREADVPLSELGRRQAQRLGRRLATLEPDARPNAIVTSPFRRARETAQIATADFDVEIRVDERLRDRDLGVLDLHTVQGITSLFPVEAERRARHGKFYYRPPGGESWTDVALRLRTFLREIEQDLAGRRVLLFAHDVIVSLTRYVLEGLDEKSLLAAAKKSPIANASLSSWVRRDGSWCPDSYNDTRHLDADSEVHTTAEPPADSETLGAR